MNNPEISHFALVGHHMQEKHLGAELLDKRSFVCIMVMNIA